MRNSLYLFIVMMLPFIAPRDVIGTFPYRDDESVVLVWATAAAPNT